MDSVVGDQGQGDLYKVLIHPPKRDTKFRTDNNMVVYEDGGMTN